MAVSGKGDLGSPSSIAWKGGVVAEVKCHLFVHMPIVNGTVMRH